MPGSLSGKFVSRLLVSTMLGGPLSAGGDNTLLAGETDGLAVDFTATTDFALSTWAMQAVQERNSSVDTLQSPHVFFTQSGTSPKYVKDSSTTIMFSPHNMLLQSEDMATTWTNNNSTETTNSTTAPDGTATADTVTQSTATTNVYMTQNVTTVSGFMYTFSCYLKASGTATDWARLYMTDGTDSAGRYFDLTNGVTGSTTSSGWTVANSGITSMGSGWYRCWVTTTVDNTTTTCRIELAEADNDSDIQASDALFVWGAQLNRGFQPTAYIKTTTAQVIGLPISYGEGLLVEPEATNLFLQSEALIAGNITLSQATATSNDGVAPDGATTADKHVPNTNNNTHGYSAAVNTVSYTSGTSYTTSIFAKAGGYDYIRFGFNTTRFPDNGRVAIFNLSNGTVEAADSGTTTSMVNVGNGWYRCAITATSDSTGTDNAHNLNINNAFTAGTGAVTYAGDGTSGVFLWGAQTETGTVATSYIPTLGSTVTRATDAVNVATSAYPHSATVGTMVIWPTYRIINNSQILRSFELSDGTSSEFFAVLAVTGDTPDSFGVSMNDNNTGQIVNTVTKAGSLSLSGNKVAFAWQANNSGIVADGSAEVTDTSCTMPTVTSLTLGYSAHTASRELNGLIRRIIYVPRRMTEAEMQGHTT